MILATVAAVIALLLWTWLTIGPTVVDVARVESERLPKLEAVQRAQFADLEASIALRNAMLYRDAERTLSELESYRQFAQEAAGALADLRARAATREEQRLISELLQAREQMQQVREAAVRFEEAQPEQVAPDAVTASLRPAFDAYVRKLKRVYDFEGEHVFGLVGSALLTAERAQQLLALSGGVAGLALLLLLRLWRKEADAALARRDAQIGRLNAQRDALVREIHHRIKNHLQGLLLLIDGQVAKGAVPRGTLAQFEAYVMALVSIHGLQAGNAGERVPLAEMVTRQLAAVEAGHPGAQLTLAADETAAHARVAAAHAVPLSLALTELLLNAVKHGEGHRACVHVSTRGDLSCVSIENEPAGARPFVWAQAQEHGTGLQLVAGLLQGMATIRQDIVQGTQRVRLTLTLPNAC